jgi:hypothetical protein
MHGAYNVKMGRHI